MRIVDLDGQSLRSIENTPAWSEVFLAHAWIDGIVGTGAHGPLTGVLAESVEVLNRLSAIKPRPVIAIDVPSGLTDDDGAITGPILRATHTLAVGTYKRAQVLPPAVEFTGDISLVTMDWDSNGIGRAEGDDGVIGADASTSSTRPSPPTRSSPSPLSPTTSTRAASSASSPDPTPTRAPACSPRAALWRRRRHGAPELDPARPGPRARRQPGVVTVGGRIQAALIGPGLDEERREDALELAQFCGQSGVPARHRRLGPRPRFRSWRTINPETTVLTPHHGEAARLLRRLGTPTKRDEVAAAPLRYANLLHDATGCHVVLKGPSPSCAPSNTRTCSGCRRLLASFINPELGFPDLESMEAGSTRCDSTLVAPTTTSWAGVAGSGDVLAGLIAGILARPVRDEHALPGPDGQPQAVTPERLVSAVCAPRSRC